MGFLLQREARVDSKGYPDILPRWETMNLSRENTASLTDQNSFTGRDDLCCQFSNLYRLCNMAWAARVQKVRR